MQHVRHQRSSANCRRRLGTVAPHAQYVHVHQPSQQQLAELHVSFTFLPSILLNVLFRHLRRALDGHSTESMLWMIFAASMAWRPIGLPLGLERSELDAACSRHWQHSLQSMHAAPECGRRAPG